MYYHIDHHIYHHIDHHIDHHGHHHENVGDGSVLSINLLRLEEHQWWARGRRNLTRIDHEPPLIWWSMMVVMIIIIIINHDEPLQHHQPLWIWSNDLRYIVSMKTRRFEGGSFSAWWGFLASKSLEGANCVHTLLTDQRAPSNQRSTQQVHNKYTRIQ